MIKKVVIVGGGFAGLQLAKCLDSKCFEVILIDKQNHHQFQPLFYQVATSRLEPSSISFPFRKIFQKYNNVNIRLAEVLQITPELNVIEADIGKFEYDYLVIATGCKTNFFGNNNISRYALPMKSTEEAIDIRNHILRNFELLYSGSEQQKEELLNIVIVGAGPTGVELAGAFAEMKKNVLPKDYHGIDFSNLKIILLDGSPNTLNSMSDDSKRISRQYLEEFGVDIKTEIFVKEYDGLNVILNNGEIIKSRNVIWAAGVDGNMIRGLSSDTFTRGNRYIVNRYNKIKGYDNIFAIGDIAYMQTPQYPNGHPQLANVAINQGKTLARNLKSLLSNKPQSEYEYVDLGSMATVGKHKAVVDLPFIRFQGYLAWFVWMFLHLMLILSVRNKLIIFFNWAWSYITKDTSLLLIFGEKKRNL